ncbi:HVO_0649 family zinc finger protein [Natronosalvus vescus]|uniref:HVO_0649 family zinc finger protein n=1 Tax=Natronosalvus vescus TaxID=2953881 RepID=UPI0020902F42|nr:HVO_0649 family zinc finger protein [Natronosalvus vescus]
MSLSRSRSPFERLRQKFDRADRQCTQCGFTTEDGGWQVTASGRHVYYQFDCPSCDATLRKELRLEPVR